jgi:hypothetical protein
MAFAGALSITRLGCFGASSSGDDNAVLGRPGTKASATPSEAPPAVNLPDPAAFDGDPFREHAAVFDDAAIDEAVAFFAEWQFVLQGCEPEEISGFEDGALHVERPISNPYTFFRQKG